MFFRRIDTYRSNYEFCGFFNYNILNSSDFYYINNINIDCISRNYAYVNKIIFEQNSYFFFHIAQRKIKNSTPTQNLNT